MIPSALAVAAGATLLVEDDDLRLPVFLFPLFMVRRIRECRFGSDRKARDDKLATSLIIGKQFTITRSFARHRRRVVGCFTWASFFCLLLTRVFRFGPWSVKREQKVRSHECSRNNKMNNCATLLKEASTMCATGGIHTMSPRRRRAKKPSNTHNHNGVWWLPFTTRL